VPTSSGFLVEVDGSPLAADAKALLMSAIVDDSLHLPDLFLLRFRDSERIVLAKSKAKIGSTITVSVTSDASTAPERLIEGEVTALEAEFDSTGTFTVIRGYDQAHRLFRGRRTESYTQSTASDVATKVAQRAGLKIGSVTATSTVFDHLSQAGVTDWEFIGGLAREIGFEVAVRDGTFFFRPPPTAADAPTATGSGPRRDPLVLRPGTELVRFRSVVTAAEQVGTVEARGWDLAQKRALVATAPAATTSAVLPTLSPADIARTFGDPVYVATDIAYRSQSEVDTAAKALAEDIAGGFAEFEGVARGNAKLKAGAAISIESVGEPFDGKYLVTTSRHRYDPITGYTTAFSVTGRQERSLFGLTSGSPARGGMGPVVGLVSDADDPEHLGRVTLIFPWLSADYVSDWARTVQAGAGRDRGAMIVPEVGDEVLVLFEQGDIRRPYVVGGLYNGIDSPPAGDPALIDSGSGAVNRRSVVSRRGHRIDLIDEDGRTEGISLTTTGGKLRLVMDSVGTAVTLHSDGTVLVEGKGGVVIDAASAKLELKGGQIALTATSGVTIDGGSGAVEATTGGPLTLKGATATLEGGAQTTVKAGGVLTVQGSLVKIN
jgi:phage protein D